MPIGRTANAIKIKTDSPKGLRAVGCACCGASCVQYEEYPNYPGLVETYTKIPENIALMLSTSDIYANLSASSATGSLSFQNVPVRRIPLLPYCGYYCEINIGDEETGGYYGYFDIIKALGKWYFRANIVVYFRPFARIVTYPLDCPISFSGSFNLLGIPLFNTICAFNENDISSFNVTIYAT